jgi:hypothetical protein
MVLIDKFIFGRYRYNHYVIGRLLLSCSIFNLGPVGK